MRTIGPENDATVSDSNRAQVTFANMQGNGIG